MRTEEQMLSLILAVAKEDERIRAVILNGSRTNPNVVKDDFQDYDVIYFVNDLIGFKVSPEWIDVFGERIIFQMPNTMKIDENDISSQRNDIVYLMLFKDFNRIDLTLVDIKDRDECKDSLSKVLLDKDHLFTSIEESSDKDYWVKKPTQKEFSDCCNEFWWVSTYVVKGLARKEVLYAKEMLEGPVRKMFMKMIAWYVAVENDSGINLGYANRFLKSYLSDTLWERVLNTYPSTGIIDIWNSLIEMTTIFHELGIATAEKIALQYNFEEANNVKMYLQEKKSIIIK